MPVVPAFCDDCGTAFRSGIVIENSTNIHFTGTRSGPCPRCGGWGHIPDGVYDFIGNTIKLLSGPQNSIRDLRRLSEILLNARSRQLNLAEVQDEIAREAPDFYTLGNLLPTSKNELYAFLALVIAALSLIISMKQKSATPNVTVNVQIQQVIEELSKEPASKQVPSADKVDKVSRNDPCPCGSGKTHKHCHGAEE